MSLTTTTISADVAATDCSIPLTSTSGVEPNKTMLRIGTEYMTVLGLLGSQAQVRRGMNGTKPLAHPSGATAYVGLPSEHSVPVVGFVAVDTALTAGAAAGVLEVRIDGTRYYIAVSTSAS